MSIEKYTKLGGILSVAAALAACGGGGSAETNEKFQAGEILTFSVGTDDSTKSESRFLIHGISSSGDLVAQDAPDLLPDKFVMLPVEASDAPDAVTLRTFYKQLWQAIKAHRGDGTNVALEIDDFDVDIVSIYRDFQRSDLSLPDYVAFYEQLDQVDFFAKQEMAEESLLEFLNGLDLTPSQWLQALQKQQWDWPRFLGLMAQRTDQFTDLQTLQKSWKTQSADDFVARYTGSPLVKKANHSNALMVQKIDDGMNSRGVAGEFYSSVVPVQPKFITTNKIGNIIKNGSFNGVFSSKIISADLNDGYISKDSFFCTHHAEVYGRAKISGAEIEYQMNWQEATNRYAPGIWIDWLSFGKPKYPRKVVHANSQLNPFSLLLANSVNLRIEVSDGENSGSIDDPRVRFDVLAKYSISKVFNSRHLVTKTTIEAGNSTEKLYCQTTTITAQ